MENLAIIIGVSEYENDCFNDLIACKNDSDFINNIIDKSKKYSKTLHISEKKTNKEILNEIELLKKEYDSKDINEIFLYFSGHGYIKNGEFYYITSNSDINTINSTSLKNSELDDIFRELNPNIFVKVVDACHSGISYIKGDESIFIKEAEKKFKKCFFMFSSMKEQSSFINGFFSDFTKAYIESVRNLCNQDNLRYSDISNYIADSFQNSNIQTPLFVIQGTMLEQFIIYNEDIRKFLKNNNVPTDFKAYEQQPINQDLNFEKKKRGEFLMRATKIRMKQGCSSSNNLLEIDSIYLTGCTEEKFYKKENLYNYLMQKDSANIQVNIYPYPELEPRLSINNEKYVKSQSDSTTLDNLLRLPRE